MPPLLVPTADEGTVMVAALRRDGDANDTAARGARGPWCTGWIELDLWRDAQLHGRHEGEHDGEG
jgi:hypothetical protein